MATPIVQERAHLAHLHHVHGRADPSSPSQVLPATTPPVPASLRTREQVIIGLTNAWRAALGRRSTTTTTTSMANPAVLVGNTITTTVQQKAGKKAVPRSSSPLSSFPSFLHKRPGTRALSTRSTSSLSTSSSYSASSSPTSSASSVSSVDDSATGRVPWQPNLWAGARGTTTTSDFPQAGTGPAADFLLAIQQQLLLAPASSPPLREVGIQQEQQQMSSPSPPLQQPSWLWNMVKSRRNNAASPGK